MTVDEQANDLLELDTQIVNGHTIRSPSTNRSDSAQIIRTISFQIREPSFQLPLELAEVVAHLTRAEVGLRRQVGAALNLRQLGFESEGITES